MRKGKAIDPDKLRLFCREHGTAKDVAKSIGRTTENIYNTIRTARISDGLLNALCNAYALAPDYFDPKPKTEPVKEAALPKETLTVASVLCGKEKSVVDELVEEMAECVKRIPTATVPKPTELPKMAVKQTLPRSYTWREKTLAEMTGEDIDRMAQSVVSGVFSTLTRELLSMAVEIKLKKDGGKYGW